MHVRDELCGRTLGEFVLRERIGEGGFGAVYRCEQPLLGREAVVKVLHTSLRGSDVVMQRFMREAQIASRIDHPYAAHVYAFGAEREDGLLWIAMEMVHGVPLDRWLRDRGPLRLEQLVPFFERLAEVVHTAHEGGIVHRDIKPSNVMVMERAGRLLPKLLDLGIAKVLGDAQAPELAANDDTRVAPPPAEPGSEDRTLPVAVVATVRDTPVRPVLTQAGAAMGSPPYMAPEQWEDATRVGPGADLYALAVLAYESLAGRRPFDANSIAAWTYQHREAPVPPLGDHFPAALDPFFQRALAKRAADRPGTALELAALLRVAAGLVEAPTDLPRLDESTRDAWIADAPQPLAEAIATLDAARNAHQVRDAAWDLVRGLLRWLVMLALAARAQVRGERDDVALLELLRALRQRELGEAERAQLLRLLVRPFASRRGAYPLPELVDLVAPDAAGDDALDGVLAMRTSSDPGGVGSDDVVRAHLARLLPVIARLLRAARFVLVRWKMSA